MEVIDDIRLGIRGVGMGDRGWYLVTASMLPANAFEAVS
jgi:hypothetical protein